jgi:hypothetical protein
MFTYKYLLIINNNYYINNCTIIYYFVLRCDCVYKRFNIKAQNFYHFIYENEG